MGIRIAVLFSTLVLLAAAHAGAACPTPFERDVVRLVNVERANQGLAPLQIDARLTAAAQGHARDMARNDFVSHTGSNGSRFHERIEGQGYSGAPLAENVAAGYSSPASVVAGWMESAGHRANILNAALGHVGVAHIEQPGSQYHNYWSQSFGASPASVTTCTGTRVGDLADSRVQATTR